MAKICKYEGCNNSRWGGGYCKYHQYIRFKDENRAVQPLSPIKRYNIPKVSDKRLEQAKIYKQICIEVDLEAKKSNNWKCFFCGEEFEKGVRPDRHHLAGRDGSLYTDKRYLVLAHRICHTKYHSHTIHLLKKEAWFNSWLERLRVISEELYNKEINKLNK